jgi:hypothetical protein
VRTALIAVVLIAAVACKDKTKTEKPKPGSASAAAGTGSAKTGSAGDPKQNTLRVPKFAGTPAVKTTKPIDKAKAEAIAKSDFDGFEKDVRLTTDQGTDIRYTTKERPVIGVSVNISKCFDCLPMDLEKWKAKTDSLKVLMGPELKDLKDTTFEVGSTEINGTTYIWTYHVGYNISPEPGTGIAGAFATAYAIHYNDGVNMIRVVAEYRDDVPKSREDMVNLTPKEDLELVGKAFIDFFVHIWG